MPVSKEEAKVAQVISVEENAGEEVWEYAVQQDASAPRTISELKNWDLILEKQAELAKVKKGTRNEEDISELELLREGHISLALQPDSSLTQPEPPSAKFNFNTNPKHVDDSLVILRYRYDKYYLPFLHGVFGSTCIVGISWFIGLYTGYIDAEQIASFLSWKNPDSPKIDLVLASKDNFPWLWYRSMQCSFIPIAALTFVYAKVRGEVWEKKQIKIEIKDMDNKLVPTRKGPSHTNLIHQVQDIREERKKRKLEPITDIIDIPATLGRGSRMPLPHRIMRRWKFGAALEDPRRLPATVPYGMLQVQTRFDKYGRVIEPWERHRPRDLIFPCILAFFTVPQFVDLITAWGT